jgi:L-ribulose-5-phosphate 3-epimerase
MKPRSGPGIFETTPFSLGVITDEIHRDASISIPMAAEMGFKYVDFNDVGERNVWELSDSEAEELTALVRDHGLATFALCPPAFKVVLLDEVSVGSVAKDPAFQEHMNILRRTFELAPTFGVSMIRMFSFRQSDMKAMGNPSPRLPQGGEIPADIFDKVVEGLQIAAGEAEAAGMTLLLENVRSCWGNSGGNLARIVTAVNHTSLRTIWDPANCYVSGGCPFPDGYEAVKSQIGEIHVKDAVVKEQESGLTRWECIGRGDVDYVGQLRALLSDGYEGVVTVETHWSEPDMTREECTRQTLAGLKECLKQALDT